MITHETRIHQRLQLVTIGDDTASNNEQVPTKQNDNQFELLNQRPQGRIQPF